MPVHDVRNLTATDDIFYESAQALPLGTNTFKADNIGRHINPPINTLVTIGMSSLYNHNPSPGSVSIVSTDANDTAGGTGVRSVRLAVRNSVSKLTQFATATLNGTTPVTVAGSWDACVPGVFRALEVGSNKKAVGEITATINGTFQANILTENTQCNIIAGVFPSNQKGMRFSILASAINDCDFYFAAKDVRDSPDAPFVNLWLAQVGGSGGVVNYSGRRGLIFTPPLAETDFRIFTRSANNRVFVYAETFVILN